MYIARERYKLEKVRDRLLFLTTMHCHLFMILAGVIALCKVFFHLVHVDFFIFLFVFLDSPWACLIQFYNVFCSVNFSKSLVL